MKKKYLNIILIVTTIIVYTIIIKRVGAISEKNQSHNNAPSEPMRENIGKNSTDTLPLLLNYKDPFLKTLETKPRVESFLTIKKPVINKRPQESASIKWPDIIYKGYIENPESHSHVAILTIDGKKHLLRTSNIINDIRVDKIFRDSVKISYLNESKILLKQ